MVKPEKFGHLHLVYHFTVPLKAFHSPKIVSDLKVRLYVCFLCPVSFFKLLVAGYLNTNFSIKICMIEILNLERSFVSPYFSYSLWFKTVFSLCNSLFLLEIVWKTFGDNDWHLFKVLFTSWFLVIYPSSINITLSSIFSMAKIFDSLKLPVRQYYRV